MFPFSSLWQKAIVGGHPLLYPYVLKLWSLFFGDSELALRSFSALFGILIIIFLYKTANRFFEDKNVGLTAALLASANYFLVWFSSQNKVYTLTAFLGLVSYYPAPESPRLLSGDGGAKPSRAFGAGFRTVSIRSPQLLLGELHFFAKLILDNPKKIEAEDLSAKLYRERKSGRNAIWVLYNLSNPINEILREKMKKHFSEEIVELPDSREPSWIGLILKFY